MPNTYSQLYCHLIFSVKGRSNLIFNIWKERLYMYISGIIKNKGQKLMIINGMPDHLHLLIGFKPNCNLSDLVRDIKASSSKWINENKLVIGNFEWQNGFGAFSIGQSQVIKVVEYISSQEEHHRKKSFREEYVAFLNEYKINFETEYLLEDFGSCNEINSSTEVKHFKL